MTSWPALRVSLPPTVAAGSSCTSVQGPAGRLIPAPALPFVSIHQSVATPTLMTTLSPRRSMVCTRRRSTARKARGEVSKRSSLPRSSGPTGKTSAVCWARSEDYLPLNTNRFLQNSYKLRPERPDSTKMVSGRPRVSQNTCNDNRGRTTSVPIGYKHDDSIGSAVAKRGAETRVQILRL